MATLILEIPDSQLKMVKNVLKAIGVNVSNRRLKANKSPNKITQSAVDDARNGKVIMAKSVDELFKSI